MLFFRLGISLIILCFGNIIYAQDSKTPTNSKITFKTFKSQDNSYGYDIYVNNVKTIHQPTIPGIQGLHGFINKVDAEKVAKLAIQKIKDGLMPPTITDEEIQKLNVSPKK